MLKWQRQFVHDARHALDNFQVLNLTTNMVEAQANTGSRYFVFTIDAIDSRDSGDKLVVIRHPWQAMYEQTPGQYTTPDYFVSKFGSARGYKLDQYHGGDVYALLECLNLLIGASFPRPEDLF